MVAPDNLTRVLVVVFFHRNFSDKNVRLLGLATDVRSSLRIDIQQPHNQETIITESVCQFSSEEIGLITNLVGLWIK